MKDTCLLFKVHEDGLNSYCDRSYLSQISLVVLSEFLFSALSQSDVRWCIHGLYRDVRNNILQSAKIRTVNHLPFMSNDLFSVDIVRPEPRCREDPHSSAFADTISLIPRNEIHRT